MNHFVLSMFRVFTLGLVLWTGVAGHAEEKGAKQPQPSQTEAQAPAPAKEGAVNINTASESELDTLPRIGPAIAKRIIAFREEHGGFKSLEELMSVSGIGEKTFARLKDQITL